MKTMDLEFSVVIDRPVEEVFSFMSDFRNHAKVFSANVDSMQTSEGPVGVGTTMRNIAKFMGMKMKENFVVTHYEKNKRIRKTSIPGSSVPTYDEMGFTDESGKTRFDLHVYAEMRGIISLFAPMLRKRVNRILAQDVKNLKTMLEKDRV